MRMQWLKRTQVINNQVEKFVFSLSGTTFNIYFYLGYPSLDTLREWSEEALHPIETLAYQQLANSRRHFEYLLRNYCAKHVLLACLQKSVEKAHLFSIDERGIRPSLLVQSRLYYKDIQVTLTHSENLGCAVALKRVYPLGIDLEKITKEKSHAIISYITAYEQNLIRTEETLQNIQAIMLWTAKESLCKAIGGGLDVFSEITEIQFLTTYSLYTEIQFKHFPEYRAYSAVLGEYVLSAVLPYSKRFSIDFNYIVSVLQSKQDQSKKVLDLKDHPQKYTKLEDFFVV